MPFLPAGAKLALDCLLGLAAAPTLTARLHTGDPPTSANELTADSAPGYAPVDLAPGAITWASSADTDSGDAANAIEIVFPANSHASADWPAVTRLGIWDGNILVASAVLTVDAAGPGVHILIPVGGLDWSLPVT